MARRVVILLLDSVGIGALPDAALYGDVGSDTLGHVAAAYPGFRLPHLAALGLGHLHQIAGVPPCSAPQGAYGKMAEASHGKDSTVGHWEIAGCYTEKPFPVYPNGFPPEIISALVAAGGRGVLGNRPASGTAIIAELGAEQMATGKWIIYTSADSVLQVAAHEDKIPLAELYDFCQKARQIMQGKHGVARVIARPYVGEPGAFVRTANRHDYSLKPPAGHLFQQVQNGGLPSVAVGKIRDIFAGDGISHYYPATNNEAVMRETCRAMAEIPEGLIWANFVDFDMLYGHRNNTKGYAEALMAFDSWLPRFLQQMQPEDLLVITSDHGNDPTMPGTDHTREYAPLLVLGGKTGALGIRSSFADLGATIAAYLKIAPLHYGTSFLAVLRPDEKREVK